VVICTRGVYTDSSYFAEFLKLTFSNNRVFFLLFGTAGSRILILLAIPDTLSKIIFLLPAIQPKNTYYNRIFLNPVCFKVSRCVFCVFLDLLGVLSVI
jgi:hypothetical protein